MLYKPGYVELLDYSVNTWRLDTACWVQTGLVRPPGMGKGIVFRPKGDRR